MSVIAPSQSHMGERAEMGKSRQVTDKEYCQVFSGFFHCKLSILLFIFMVALDIFPRLKVGREDVDKHRQHFQNLQIKALGEFLFLSNLNIG